MSRNTKIALFGVSLLALSLIAWILLRTRATSTPTDIPTETGDLFPSSGTRPIGGTGTRGERTTPSESGANFEEYTPEALSVIAKETPLYTASIIINERTAGFVDIGKGTTTALRYVARENGHIYEIGGEDGPIKISNQTIPKVYDARWSPNGSRVILRYLSADTNELQALLFSVGTSSAQALPFPLSNSRSWFSPDNRLIFSIETDGEGSAGVTYDINGKNRRILFRTDLREITAQWSAPNALLIYTKPSGLAEGTIYTTNTTTGGLNKLMGGRLGVSAKTDGKGRLFILSSFQTGGVNSLIYSLASKTDSPFPLPVIPEKCVFSQKSAELVYCGQTSNPAPALYPDDWYKGVVGFNDAIWSVDVANNETVQLSGQVDQNPQFVGIDAIELSLNSNEDVLYFKNKRDGKVWAVRVK